MSLVLKGVGFFFNAIEWLGPLVGWKTSLVEPLSCWVFKAKLTPLGKIELCVQKICQMLSASASSGAE